MLMLSDPLVFICWKTWISFFFSCRESKTVIVMLTRISPNWHWHWTTQTQRKIFPYQWGHTNGLWYCLVKKLIDIYSYGPSFAHLPITLIGVRPSNWSNGSINTSITCPFSPFCFCPMALPIPNVLVVGHSFLKEASLWFTMQIWLLCCKRF